ncbi:hypothetical protein F0562_001909 [Nyssa sinensis]|uniref:Phytosulfokine n=1 Tax=Nyssa sinensis TaxID=561372 RepID=A0A5J5C4H8_9ASTE|nr:hypothetical protein F0562_001909 [Nyssa sinensis]
MKQSLHPCALLFLLLILLFSSQTSARFRATQQVEEVKLNKITSDSSIVEMEGNDSLNQLMGLEICDDGDKECLKRRIAAEAHLDYIYTQHHKP